MTSTVIQQLPTVDFEADGDVPAEENDTHILLSYIAFNVAAIDKPLRMSDRYHKYADEYRGDLEVVYPAGHELKWDQIQEFLRLLTRHTQAVYWYPLRNFYSDLKRDEQIVRIVVEAPVTSTEAPSDASHGAVAETVQHIPPGPGEKVVAAYRSTSRLRAFDQHFIVWANSSYMACARNEMLPSAEDGGPTLEPLPGFLLGSYAQYLSVYEEQAMEPLPAPSDKDDGYEAPQEVAVRTRAFYWHCCAWAHYKLGELVESRLCFHKATATPFNRFNSLQQESMCPVPGIAPYPDQEYLLWQIRQQLPRGYPWDDGNLERLYWLSMALTVVSPEEIPDLARLFSEYLGLMLQVQYYFVANLKTQAFAALISDCEAAERQAPAEHKELYSMLNDEAQQGRALHMTDHPTATEAEKDAIQKLYGAFSARQAVEEYRRLIQSYVGS